jgi:hypothetical protein
MRLPPWLMTALTIMGACLTVGCHGQTATVTPASSGVHPDARPWASCLLKDVPPGACKDGWGGAEVKCDPERFMDQTRFEYVPDHSPNGFPLKKSLHIHWHIMLHSNGSGDVPDASIIQMMQRANHAFEPAGIQFETTQIQRHRRGDLATCRVTLDERMVKNPQFDICGSPSVSLVAKNPKRFINVYLLDIKDPTAFAPLPCIYPPGDPRTGLFLDRSVSKPQEQGVFVHELGHFFGLLHVFHNWNWADASKDSGCMDRHNDYVKDTITQKNAHIWPSLNCLQPPTSCPKATQRDQVSNIMQYGACAVKADSAFTTGQIRRMQWTLVRSRTELITRP